MRKLDPHPTPIDIEPELTPYLWHPTPVGPLPSEDGVPPETFWHVLQLMLLLESLSRHWRDRSDSFVAGDIFVYWDEELARKEYFRGPDFFAIKDGVSKRNRDHWEVWMENGRYPDVIIELMSRQTRNYDLTTKKQVYEECFDTPNLVAYDPDSKELFVWHKIDGRFRRVAADQQGRCRLAAIDLQIGNWQGDYMQRKDYWIRFFDLKGELLPLAGEEDLRADTEKARADALAAELARLKSQRKS